MSASGSPAKLKRWTPVPAYLNWMSLCRVCRFLTRALFGAPGTEASFAKEPRAIRNRAEPKWLPSVPPQYFLQRAPGGWEWRPIMHGGLASRIRSAVRWSLETAPIGRLIAPRFAGSATIFVLHHVVRGENNALDRGLAVTEKFLDAAIAHVIGRGYRIASLSELSQWMGTGQMTPPVVVFTFDDGYVSNAAMAAPIFEKYKVPWCLYLTTGFPDRTCSYWWRALELLLLERDVVEFDLPPLRRRYHVRSMSAKRAAFSEISRIVQEHAIDISQYLRCRYGSDARSLLDAEALSWRDVRDLMSNRFFELGAHTVSHPVLANLDEQSARREMVDCRRRIREVTGVEVSHFAYPFGS